MSGKTETRIDAKAESQDQRSHKDQTDFFDRNSVDGLDIQAKFAKANLALIGGGAIASHALAALADSGVQRLSLIDSMALAPVDVGGNALLTEEDLGINRAEALGRRAAARWPQVDFKSFTDEVTDRNLPEALGQIDLALALLDAPNPRLFSLVNRVALRLGVPWISGQISEGVGLTGPAFIPWETACYRCFELRRDLNLEDYDQMKRSESQLERLPKMRTRREAPRPMYGIVGGMAAMDALRIISKLVVPLTFGRVLRIDFFSPETTIHRVLRMPHCPECGGKGKRILPRFRQLPPGR